MRKTYFLLLLSVIMSWQIVNAFVNPESIWNISHYLSTPKLNEIITRVNGLVEEEDSKKLKSLNKDGKQFLEISTLNYPIQYLNDYEINSCTPSTVTTGNYLFDLTKIATFYTQQGINLNNITVYYNQTDLQNNTNGILPVNLPNTYDSASGNTIYVKVIDVNATDGFVTYPVRLRNLTNDDLIVNVAEFTTHFCKNQLGEIKISGTPGATVTYEVVYNGTTTPGSFTINQNGTYTLQLNNLNTVGNGHINFNTITFQNCTKTLTPLAKNFNVIDQDSLTVTLTQSGLVCNGSQATYIVTGTPGATLNYNMSIGGVSTPYTFVIPESGTGNLLTPILTVGTTPRLLVNNLTLGSCSKTITGQNKNISVRTDLTASLELVNSSDKLCTDNTVKLRVIYANAVGLKARIFYSVNGFQTSVIADSSPFTLNISMPSSIASPAYNVLTGNINVRLDKIELFNEENPESICTTNFNNISTQIPFLKYYSCTLETIEPFCVTDPNSSGITFSNATNSPTNNGSIYCLGSSPHSFWKFLQVDQGGTLSFDILQTDRQGTPRDVDFVAYGPFFGSLNPLERDNTISSICCQISQINSLWFVNGTNQTLVPQVAGCSYTANATEEFYINNVQPGAIYVVLFTNFSQQSGSISFSENPDSTGNTSCDIICPLYLGEDFSICPGQEVTLTATIENADSYIWYKDGQVIQGERNQTIVISSGGTYKVVVNKRDCPIMSDEIRITADVIFDYTIPEPKGICPDGEFDLSTVINNIIPNANNYIISYHLTNSDALDGINLYTGDLSQYQIASDDENLYVSIRSRNVICPVIVPIRLIKNQCINPIDLYTCSTDLNPVRGIVDLTGSINNLLNQTILPDKYLVNAYLSENDARNNINPITDITQVSVEDQAYIWFRRYNINYSTEYQIFSLKVNVIEGASIVNEQNTSFGICEGAINQEIEGTPGATITYTLNNSTEEHTLILDNNGYGLITIDNVTSQQTINFVKIQKDVLVTIDGEEETKSCERDYSHIYTYSIADPINLTVSNNVTACLNTTSPVITLSTTNTEFPFTVKYSVNGGPEQTAIINSATQDIQVPTNAVGEFVYHFTSVVGTGGSVCFTPLNLNVNATIYNLPTATLTGDSQACTNDSRTYTISGPANATVVYSINGVNNTVNLGANGEYQFTQVIDQNYTISLVSIQDQSGCSNALTNTINVVATNLPVATIAGSTSICNGTSTVLEFQGTPNAVVTFSANGQEYTVTLGADGSGRFTTPNLTATTVYNLVSIQGACANTLTGSATVTVLDLPTATIEGTTQVCLNSAQPSVTFTGANGVAPYTFTYTINGGAPQTVTSTTNSVTVAAPTTTAGVFEYALVSVSSSTTPACSNTASGSASVTVLELPVASVTASAEVCLGAQGTVNFTGTPNATVTYTIDGVNQTVVLENDGTQSIVVTVNNNVTITLVSVQDVQGCTSALTQSATITKVDLPVATIAGSTSICNGTSTVLEFQGTPNAVVTFSANGQEYTVTLGADGSDRFTTPNLTATTVYNLVSIQGACANTLTGSATVTVLDLPTATIEGTTQVCLNSAQPTVTFTGANGVAPYTFTYTINGGAPQTVTSTTNSVTVAVPTTAAGVFEYTLVSVSSSTTPACSNTASGSASVTVLELPVASVTASAEVCLGEQGTVNFTGTPNATVTYTIDGVNQTVVLGEDGTQTINVTVNNNVTITLVSVQDVQGCTSALTQSTTITKVDLPVATISGSTSICNGTSTVLEFQGTPNAVVTFSANGQEYTVTLLADGSGRFTTPNLTATTVYSLVSIQGACSNTLTGSATVTVLDLPTATIEGTTQVCLNSAQPTVTFTGANGVAPYTFTYTINGGAPQTVTSTTNSVTVAVPTTAAGVFEYTLVSVSSSTTPACNNTATGSASVTVLELPVASVTASAEVCLGAQGTVNFTGTPNATVTYTIDGVNQTVVLDNDGIQSINVTVNNNVTITLVSVQDVQGCTSALTQSATITKVDLPVATIAGSTSICNGTSTELIFQGTPNAVVTFSANGQEYTVTLGADGFGRFTTPNLTATTVYNLVSIQGACSNTLTGSATVTILDLPTATVTGNQTICNGNNASVQITGTPNATVTYTVNGVTETVVLGNSGTANVVLNGLTTNTTVRLVSIRTIATVSCANQLTDQVVITVIPVPTITDLTAAANTICSGEATGIQIFGNTTDVQFTWTVVATNGVTGATAGTGNIISQQLTAVNIAGTVTYSVTPFIGGCQGVTQQITITVTPVPTLTLSSGNFAICNGDTATINISSNVDTAFYTWNAVSTNGIQGASGGTGTSISQTLINNSNQVGTVTYTVTPYNGNCQGTPKTVVVTVYPTPTVIATPTQESLCSGNQTNITLTSNIVNTTYTWTVIANGVTGALPGSGSQINQTLRAVGVPGTVQYIITPTVNGCVGEPTTVTVTVTPRPEIFANSNPPAICSESFTGIALSASLEGTTFEWTVVQNGVEGAFAGTGSTINQQLFTLGNSAGTAIYTVTPYANGCAGNPVTITVRVNPLPLSKLKEGYICYDPIKDEVISTYVLNSGLSQSNFSFVWMLDGEVIPGANQSTYEVVVGGQYTLVVTNSTTNCTSTQIVNVQESHPAVSATYELSNYFNSAQTLTINVVGTGNYIYQLNDEAPQESNVFTNVLPGTHSVTITDQNGCTYIVIDNITTMQFPNFFTPNGDGINDTWNIWSLENQEDARIFIFDRQGKLVKQISPRGAGWDGTLNGTPLPSTDYWFSVEYYENGKLRNFKSHFSLKR